MPSAAENLPRKNNAGKKVFVNRSLCSTKHACKGITSGLKKSPHLATLRLVLTAGVAACFVSHGRSFLIRGYSCPLKPQQGIRICS
jgi:hypothetical protein